MFQSGIERQNNYLNLLVMIEDTHFRIITHLVFILLVTYALAMANHIAASAVLLLLSYYCSMCLTFILAVLFLPYADACASAPEVKINRGIEFTKNQLQAVDLSPQDFEMTTIHPETVILTCVGIFVLITFCCCSFWLFNRVKKGYQHRGSRYLQAQPHQQAQPQPQAAPQDTYLGQMVALMSAMFNREAHQPPVVYAAANQPPVTFGQPSAPPQYNMPTGI